MFCRCGDTTGIFKAKHDMIARGFGCAVLIGVLVMQDDGIPLWLYYHTAKKLSAPSCSSQELAKVGMYLFRHNYRWEKPVRSIGLRGSGLVKARRGRYRCPSIPRIRGGTSGSGLTRQRYGDMSIRRALMDSDPLLGHINVEDGHTVHPVGQFGG